MPTPIRLLQPTDDLERAIDDFAVRLRAQGRSELTISAYLRDLRCFAHALPTGDVQHVTPGMIDAALTDPAVALSENGAPKSPATIHRLKAVVRSFFAWAADGGLIEINPAKSVATSDLPPESWSTY